MTESEDARSLLRAFFSRSLIDLGIDAIAFRLPEDMIPELAQLISETADMSEPTAAMVEALLRNPQHQNVPCFRQRDNMWVTKLPNNGWVVSMSLSPDVVPPLMDSSQQTTGTTSLASKPENSA